MTQSIKYYIAGLTLVLMSCAHKVVAPVVTESTEKLPREKKHELVESLDSISQHRPKYFYAKISTSYTDTTSSFSFKTSVRMTKDSALNALFTFAKIPLFNALLGNDTIQLVNRRDKCYLKTSLTYLKNDFGVDITHANLEELILGFPIGYDTTQRYFKIQDPQNYVISSHKKRIVKRVDRIESRVEDKRTAAERERDRLREVELERINRIQDGIVIRYFLNPDKRSLKAMKVESVEDSTFIEVDYIEREWMGPYSIPKVVKLTIRTPRNLIRIDLDYEKVEVDIPQQFHFVIPEEYENCR